MYKLPKYLKVILLLASYGLLLFLLYLLSNVEEENWLQILGLSFVMVWLLVLFGFIFFQLFKYFRFSDSLYEIKKIESYSCYKKMGVELFQKALINSFFKYLNPRVYLKGKGREYLKTYYEETKQAESSHLISLFFTVTFSFYLLYLGKIEMIISLNFFSILFNIYPILLQRKNRFYLERRLPSLLD